MQLYVFVMFLLINYCMALPRTSQEENVINDIFQNILNLAGPKVPHDKFFTDIDKKRNQFHLSDSYEDKSNQRHNDKIIPEFTESVQITPEYTESVESKSRESRQYNAKKHYPICLSERKFIKLNTDEYEYRPAYYEEMRCMLGLQRENEGPGRDVCSSLGLSCVQWNKTIHLTRRQYNSECWETRTMIIPAGCE